MNYRQKYLSACIAALLVGAAPAFAASSGPSDFTVLANAAVTCTNGSIIGDVGTNLAPPLGSVTLTTCPVTGTVHVGDAAAIAAYNAFLLEYTALAGQSCDSFLTGTLAGVTLTPGVYCFEAAAALTGTLTLAGPSNGTWLFKIGSGAVGALTGTDFSVVLANGASSACNVTWWVDAAATMTDSKFVGTILAGAGITTTRGTFNGDAFAKADVTVTGTAVTGCEGGSRGGTAKPKCNQGVGNGPEFCDPGNSNQGRGTSSNPFVGSNDELGGTPSNPGRKGGNFK